MFSPTWTSSKASRDTLPVTSAASFNFPWTLTSAAVANFPLPFAWSETLSVTSNLTYLASTLSNSINLIAALSSKVPVLTSVKFSPSKLTDTLYPVILPFLICCIGGYFTFFISFKFYNSYV